METRSPLKVVSMVGHPCPGRREVKAWGLGSPHGNEGHIPRISSASSPHWPQLVVDARTGELLGGGTGCVSPQSRSETGTTSPCDTRQV